MESVFHGDMKDINVRRILAPHVCHEMGDGIQGFVPARCRVNARGLDGDKKQANGHPWGAEIIVSVGYCMMPVVSVPFQIKQKAKQ